MPMTANGLAKLLEELGELSQVAAKKLAYFNTDNHPDNAGLLSTRLENEMADVNAAILFVTSKFGLDEAKIKQRTSEKLALFEKWHKMLYNNTESFDSLSLK
jgi:NTP pyrophosphatase (non-canonical NTP hydrolase)